MKKLKKSFENLLTNSKKSFIIIIENKKETKKFPKKFSKKNKKGLDKLKKV